MNTVYFTTKVATDASFCNRTAEQQTIINSVHKNQHMVIVAPRRYGKTSLVVHTLTREKIIFARIDLFCAVYEEDICRKVAKSVSSLARQITTFSEKSLQFIGQCFKLASIAIKAGKMEIKVELEKPTADSVAQLEDLLEGLEKLAKKQKKSVVLFFDEFQDVLKTSASNKIQAAIRAIAQHSKYVTYIFSGSSRVMLNKIFDDKKQPLYMLCKKIMLERITKTHLATHMQAAFSKRWKKHITPALIDVILTHTACHSYYVNVLCDKLWDSKITPTLATIETAWQETVDENKGKIIADLEPLNTNRLKVLTTIALLNGIKEPSSKYFLDHVKLPLSSVQNTIKYLLDYDFIHHTDSGLTLIDPVMQIFIQEKWV
jgi:AAA+ ATPase superfamily predicted ATPase